MFMEYEEQCNFFQGIHPEKKYRVVLTEKKYLGICIPKIWQILKHFWLLISPSITLLSLKSAP